MKFEEPKMNVITFSAADIVTASGEPMPTLGVNLGGTVQKSKDITYNDLFQ